MAHIEQAPSYPVITGVGACVSGPPLTNEALIQSTGIESTPQWIVDHTGVEGRHWAEEGVLASDLATEAAQAALHTANLTPADVTSIYLATGSPDYPMPSTASIVHGKLGASPECSAIELRAACAGFAVGLEAASDRLQVNPARSNALVIGTELASQRVDKSDRRSVILFGDGAGAAVMQLRPGASRPVSTILTQPDKEAVYIPAGGNAQPVRGPYDPESKLIMNGPAVKKHALAMMTRAAQMVASQAGLTDNAGHIDWDQIDLFVPHQANRRLIEAVGKELNVPAEKCLVTVDRFGNTSSASIPMALATAHQEGLLSPGRKRVLFTAIGAGMIAGAMLMDMELPER